MPFLGELEKIEPPGETAVTMGVFDGVHLGHQYLIRKLVRQSQKHGLISAVITFHPHPRLVLSPEKELTYLISLEERLRLIRGQGVDLVLTLPFTKELSRLTAREFMGLVCQRLKMRLIIMGPDFALGHGREGDAPMLRALGAEMGYHVYEVDRYASQGEEISSSAVRAALLEGDMARAAGLLGRPFSLSGVVVPGVGRGRALGFPTANLALDSNLALPRDGIYVCRVHLGETTIDAVANIGRRPSFEDGERLVEVHLLDFQGELYRRELRVELLHRLRDEVRFERVEELVSQIHQDVAQARQILERRHM